MFRVVPFGWSLCKNRETFLGGGKRNLVLGTDSIVRACGHMRFQFGCCIFCPVFDQ